MFNKFLFSFLLLLFLVLKGNASTIRQPCRTNGGRGSDCFHVFQLSLSERPPQESTQKIDTTMVKVVKNTEHGDNYYEIIIANGTEITPEQYKEILKQLPKNSDEAFVQTVVNNKIYLRPVDSKNEVGTQIRSVARPEPQNSRNKPQQAASNHFPVVLVALLLCIGIVLGILCTGLCLFMAHLRNQPTFDRTNVVTYRKIEISRSSAAGSRRGIGEQNVELLRRDGMGSIVQSIRQQHNHTPTTVSQASTSRLAPRGIATISSRQISL